MLGEFPPYEADPASHFRSTKSNNNFQLALKIRTSTQPRMHTSDAANLTCALHRKLVKPSSACAGEPFQRGWHSGGHNIQFPEAVAAALLASALGALFW